MLSLWTENNVAKIYSYLGFLVELYIVISNEWGAEWWCKWEEMPKISDLGRKKKKRKKERGEDSKSRVSIQVIYQSLILSPKIPRLNSIDVN